MKLFCSVVVIAAVTTAAGSAVAAEPIPANSADRTTIVVGHVSDNPRRTHPRLEAMAGFLARRLASVGVTAGAVLVARDNADMVNLLRDKRVDVLSETVFSALTFQDAGAADILLVEFKRGIAAYRTVFFTRKDSGIRTLRDLVGRKIGFEDPGSTTSYQLPRLILEGEGMTLRELATPDDPVPPGTVGYRFMGQEVNIAAAVASGAIAAGAFSNRDWDRLDRIPDRIKRNLSLLHLSNLVPRSLFLVRRGLRPEIRETVRKVLLAGPETQKEKDEFRRYYGVADYKALDDATRAELERLRDLRIRLEKALTR